MTVESTIDYEGLAQEAMRGVVRKVLVRTAKSGLAGDHHFYISFDTEAPGVSLSKRLKEKYPREMTIVLQHRFWDLAVTEERFEVKLTFDGIPERLVVPFAAVKVFFDPSVRFGLQFDDSNAGADSREPGNAFESMTPRGTLARTSHARKSNRTSRKSQAADEAEAKAAPESGDTQKGDRLPEAASPATPLSPTPLSTKSGTKGTPAEEQGAASESADAARPGGAEIVSLDKFRKK